MSKLLSEWSPSESAVNLIKLNGISNEQIEKSVEFLKSKDNLKSIDNVDGYDNWDSFFIMSCIKANKSTEH